MTATGPTVTTSHGVSAMPERRGSWDAYPEWLRMLVCAGCLHHDGADCRTYVTCFLCGAIRRCICCAPPSVGPQRCCQRLTDLYVTPMDAAHGSAIECA